MVDAGDRDGVSLLGLAEDAQGRALFRADRVAAAFAAGHRNHANLGAGVFVPLAVGGQAEGFVIRVGADEEDVEIDIALRLGVANRRRGRRCFRRSLPGRGGRSERTEDEPERNEQRHISTRPEAKTSYADIEAFAESIFSGPRCP